MTAQAIDFTYTHDCSGLVGGSGGSLCTDIKNEVESVASSDLPDVDISKYSDGTANATVIANTGKGSDYGQNFDLFTIKINPLGIGVDASEGGLSDPDNASGVAIGAGLMVGVNMDAFPIGKIGFFDFDKLDVMFNFMNLNVDQELDSAEASGEVSGLGLMARYRIMDPVDILPGYMVQWGGVMLHTGFQKSKMNMSLVQNLNDETISGSQGAFNYTGSFTNASGTFEIDSNTTVIPIEVSTYIRLAYAFTFYGGLGMDIASGESKIGFNGSGTVNVNAGAGGNYTGTIAASQVSKGEPESAKMRGFLGVQINAPVVSLYVHANKQLAADVIGVNLGLNIGW
jgi:hypothetical protein